MVSYLEQGLEVFLPNCTNKWDLYTDYHELSRSSLTCQTFDRFEMGRVESEYVWHELRWNLSFYK
jgi:hypothetical protein